MTLTIGSNQPSDLAELVKAMIASQRLSKVPDIKGYQDIGFKNPANIFANEDTWQKGMIFLYVSYMIEGYEGYTLSASAQTRVAKNGEWTEEFLLAEYNALLYTLKKRVEALISTLDRTPNKFPKHVPSGLK